MDGLEIRCVSKSQAQIPLQTIRTSRLRLSAGWSQSHTTRKEQATQHWRL